MNRHDSERLEGALRRFGLEPAPDPAGADLVLLNTCSVREKPVHKIVSRIGHLGAGPGPRPLIGVCGCVAQQEGEALLATSPAVAFVLGPGCIPLVGEALDAVARGERPVLTGFDRAQTDDPGSVARRSPVRGMVTVIEGCDEYCTYCVVPYTRGRQRSRPLAAVLDEVRALAAEGVREVELLGQTINSYRCPESGADLAELLHAAASEPALDRVRFITSHPRHFSERLIKTIATQDAIAKYLHLPFQAGSNRVLARMHRRYTREEYLDLVARVRSAIPTITLSTDVIVGFPGEREEDVELTLDLLEEVRFGQVFAFAFSPRPRTPAARYPEQVPSAVAADRLQRVLALADRITGEENARLVGTEVRVLIDAESRRSSQEWQGRGEDNRVVNFPKTGAEAIGDLVSVRILAAGPHSLRGTMVGGSRRLPVLESAVSFAP